MTLAELRFNAGLSPQELGEAVHVAETTIRRIEDGKRPTPRVAKKIADHFGVKPSDIWPVEKAGI